MSVATETVHLFGENPQMCGILTLPDKAYSADSQNTAVVILSSGLLHRAGPYRLHVDLARRLAGIGLPVLRIDQSGRGDSSRSVGINAEQTIQHELQYSAQLLREHCNTNRIILVGLCSGADDALALAADNEAVCGLVLLDGFAEKNYRYYLSYFAERLLGPRRVGQALWLRLRRSFRLKSGSESDGANEAYEELAGIRNLASLGQARDAFGKLFARDGRAVCIFTGGVKDYYCAQGQLRDNLGLSANDKQLVEIFNRDANHTYPISRHRRELVEQIAGWLVRRH